MSRSVDQTEGSLTIMRRKVVRHAVEADAFTINKDEPIVLDSGHYSPLIFYPERLLKKEYTNEISTAFKRLMYEAGILQGTQVIAGNYSKGKSHAQNLALDIGAKFLYVDKNERHQHLNGKQILLIENIIEGGMPALGKIESIKNSGGEIKCCYSLFNYEMSAKNQTRRYERDKTLECQVNSVITYDSLFDTGDFCAKFKGQIDILKEFAADPVNWGKKFEASDSYKKSVCK